MRRNLILALILSLLVIVFAIQNDEPVNIMLFFWPVTVRPALLVIIVLLIGVLLGIFVSSAEASRKEKKKETQPAPKEGSETEPA